AGPLPAGLSGDGLADDGLGAGPAPRRPARQPPRGRTRRGGLRRHRIPPDAADAGHRGALCARQGVQLAQRGPSGAWAPHRAGRQGPWRGCDTRL
ncbi:hypothetical protein ABTM83_19180, partial [Acinetobacter baumannii]